MAHDNRPAQFQSNEAKKAAVRLPPDAADEGGPKSAQVGPEMGAPPPVIIAVELEDQNKMVKIRPRETIPRMRYGNTWFSFTAGKECLVPKHLETQLAERGLI